MLGGGGGDSHYVGRSVDGSKPDMTGEKNQKQAGSEETKEQNRRAERCF